jgi:hypothetical protein
MVMMTPARPGRTRARSLPGPAGRAGAVNGLRRVMFP